jgi:hypothetical protein
MKLIKKMVFCATISLLLFLGTKVIAEAPLYENTAKQSTPQEYIVEYAKQFELNPELLLKIAKCESHLDPLAEGDYKNGTYLAIGIYQYHQDMWNGSVLLYRKEVYDEPLDRYSYHDQAKLTSFIFAKHPELRKKWTSYVAYMNGGTYTFYSKLLGKYFTVVCK